MTAFGKINLILMDIVDNVLSVSKRAIELQNKEREITSIRRNGGLTHLQRFASDVLIGTKLTTKKLGMKYLKIMATNASVAEKGKLVFCPLTMLITMVQPIANLYRLARVVLARGYMNGLEKITTHLLYRYSVSTVTSLSLR